MKHRYVFDSNSMRVLRNYYPEQFPSFWKRFDAAVQAGHVVSVREVFNELEHLEKGMWIWDWAQTNKAMFAIPTDDETAFVGEIFAIPHFRTLVGEIQTLKGRPVADPFVIAGAKCCGGCVVTEEAKKPNAAKIPNVCEHFDIHCTNVQGFMKQNGWSF
jgi:hypothetical protein